MPPITAILHTSNDGIRLGRALETLRACDEIIVVDHRSADCTLRVAREYGATIRSIETLPPLGDQVRLARNDWVLFLLPSEAVSEALEATLYEWKLYAQHDVAKVSSCAVFIREETGHGWAKFEPSTRLVPRDWQRWDGELRLPLLDLGSRLLDGDLLRFRAP
jgi:glycosyltransferase involved in cell wall biosynthesis